MVAVFLSGLQIGCSRRVDVSSKPAEPFYMEMKMFISTHVLALLVLQVGLVKSFSWDIMVLGKFNMLEYYYNGTHVHTEEIPSDNNIDSIAYDPVQYRLLFVENVGLIEHISSLDLTTRDATPILRKSSDYYLRVAYDPVTQSLFWRAGFSIYSFSLNPTSTNNTDGGNLILQLHKYCTDMVVDICGRYIYWVTNDEIERARFDGSDREVLLSNPVWGRLSMAIDLKTQKIYWAELIDRSDNQVSIVSADFNGKNVRTLYTVKNETQAVSLIVSNGFIYWIGNHQRDIWQLPINHSAQLEAKLIARTNRPLVHFNDIVANYTMTEPLIGAQNCESLKSLIPKESEPDSMLCVHGTKVSAESRCECTQGYTGDRCDVYGCQNYCLEGNCSVSADGLPKCRCKAGYSGERCEVNTCHNYCLNSGVCSLNVEHIPVCQCKAGYDGERCDFPAVAIKCIQTVSMLKDTLNADLPPVTQSKEVQSTCATSVI